MPHKATDFVGNGLISRLFLVSHAASTTSPWMYAVIAVGTIFVISVAAALYNMW